MNPKAQIINLLQVPGLGPHRIRGMISTFSLETDFFQLSIKELCSVPDINQKTARSIKEYSRFEFSLGELERARKLNTNIVSFYENSYPQLLQKIYDPPVLLYVRGNSLRQDEDCVAIVGTRTMTEYGKEIAAAISKELTGLGITIVSGLARGVDTTAHRTCVESGGRTIAVFGTGVDRIYPAENKALADKIFERGAIVSEFPFGTKPDAPNFPRRNRVISGLCHATIIIEAGTKSGAILTALNAVDQNREVFAVPGRLTDKQSIGCNRLIRNGAIPFSSVDRLLEHIQSRMNHPLKPVQQSLVLDLTHDEIAILEHLNSDPLHIDDLSAKVGVGVSQLLTSLLQLELKGAVVQLSGKHFVRANNLRI